jgi:type IV pilus assembly protein PilW
MMRPRPCLARSGGMTLAELLVALTVGLGVVLGAGRLLAHANAAYAAQMEALALDDGGHYALELIGRALRQAAAVDPETLLAAAEPGALAARLAGLDASSVARTSSALDDPLPDAANGSDVLALRFPGAGAGPDGDGSMVSCAGFAVPQGEEGWSIFHVAKNGEGEPELRCKYRGAVNWSADAVVTGVDGFQLLYGIDTDEPRDGTPNRYVNASTLRSLDAALGAGSENELNRRTWWKRVVSVRVALLLHGARVTRSEPGTIDYYLFGAGQGDAADAGDPGTALRETAMTLDLRRRERRLFTMTVALPAALP